ncbi:MAG: LPXTG cell wall anchor domain-containing protein, partial [Lachnospiraceae bacterium]|nr:LPXTG cell wall anchor domain-containing protein [Lachnospiraceae bacterium]
YTAREGSTIITLEAAYLNTLSVGTHTFELIWTDGSANTTVTINANASGNSALPGGTNKKDDVPKTGDSTPIVGLFILAGLSGAGLIFTGRKGRKNPEASGE